MTVFSYFEERDDGTFNVVQGAPIEATIKEAIRMSTAEGRQVTFGHNRVTVHVNARSDARLILRDWYRALRDAIPNGVGPTCKATLTPDDLAEDDRKSRDYGGKPRRPYLW